MNHERRTRTHTLTLSKPRKQILTRVKEALSDAGTLGPLMILAAVESLRHRRPPPPPRNSEQLHEYGDEGD